MWRQFWQFLYPHRRVFYLSLAAMVVAAIFSVSEPYLIKIAIDKHMLKGDFSGIKLIAFLFLVVVIAEYASKTVYTYGLQTIGSKMIGALRRAVYKQFLGFEIAYFDRTPTGVLLSRTVSDAESLSESLATGIVSIFLDALTIASICAMMIWLAPRLSLSLLVLAPLLWTAISWFGARLKHSFSAVRHWNAELSGFLDESITGLSILQLFRKTDARIREFIAINKSYCDATVKSNLYDASLYALMEGLAALCIGSLLVALSFPALGAAVSAGLVVAFIEYLQRIFMPIKEFSAKIAAIQRAAVDLERIFGVLQDHSSLRDGTRVLSQLSTGIRFDRVSFRYRADGEWVLRDISFDVKAGEKIAIVGATGSGKTTLVKLLLRQYDPSAGTISIDGIPLHDLRRQDLNRAASLVAQDVFLFDASLADNISMGRPEIDLARIHWAAQVVHADRFISRYPDAYTHRVRERGANLSAGEAQLVAFARAMAGPGDLVILDEATGNIDSESEREIEEATLAIFARKTTIAIAHRLSTLKHVDRILVMRHGEIVESGTHAELLARRGEYYRLYETQYAVEIA